MFDPIAEIRPAERRVTFAAFLVLLGTLAGHAVLETARDALFLAELPPERLAWVYLAVAVVSLGLFFLEHRRRGGVPSRLTLSLWLFASAGVNVGFWFLSAQPAAWIWYALYVWTGVFATLVVVRFWTLIGELFTVAQAKRLFAFVGLGGVLGAIVGSALARAVAESLEARHLLPASAALLAVAAIGPLLLFPRPVREESGESPEPAGDATRGEERIWDPLRTIWSRAYLRRVAGVVLLATVTLTWVDFVFKHAVAMQVEPEALGAFFATVYLVLNLLALAAQIFLVRRLVRRSGVDVVLAVLPAMLLLGSVGILLGGGLIAALVLKGVDGTLRHTLHRTAVEVLYVPLAGDLRHRIKAWIDVLGQRGGQALASLALLPVAGLGAVEAILAAGIVGLTVAWVRTARSLRQHYLELFRETISEVALRTRMDFPEIDLASLESLIGALNSTDDGQVLATMELLAEQNRVRLIPALILYHPSSRVVIRALELFSESGRDDFTPITERLLEHADPEVRAASLRALAWVSPDPALYQRFVRDPSPAVEATALVGLVSYGAEGAEEALRQIELRAWDGDEEEKLALARAIRYSPGALYESALLQLALSRDPRTRRSAVEAMREVRSAVFVEPLIRMLSDRNLRSRIRQTLVDIGTEALAALGEGLADESLDRGVRRQVPRAVAQFGSERAATILMEALAREGDGAVRYRILRALGRMRDEQPSLPLDRDILERTLDDTLSEVFLIVHSKIGLAAGARRDPARKTAVQGLIAALLEQKEEQAVERVFRLLGLLFPGENLRTVYRGLRSGDPKLRASSMELLEYLVPSPHREPLLAAVDDLPDGEKLARAGIYHRRHEDDYAGLLRELLEQGGVGMRSLVAYHVGELQLAGLRDALEHLPGEVGAEVSQVAERALARLGAAAGGKGA